MKQSWVGVIAFWFSRGVSADIACSVDASNCSDTPGPGSAMLQVGALNLRDIAEEETEEWIKPYGNYKWRWLKREPQHISAELLPMPVIIGSVREINELSQNVVDRLGITAFIWAAPFKTKYISSFNNTICTDVDETIHGVKTVKMFRTIIDDIKSNKAKYDLSKTVATGFSATAKVAMLFHCFSQDIAGIYASGSGVAVDLDEGSDRCGNLSWTKACDSVKGGEEREDWLTEAKAKEICECTSKYAAEECGTSCRFKPVFPCSTREKTFTIVGQTGKKDYLKYEVDLLYELTKREGLDARLQVFNSTHRRVKHFAFWIYGTFGMREYCSSSCEDAVRACVDPSSSVWGKSFEGCFTYLNKAPSICEAFCAPSLNMLELGKDKLMESKGIFGPPPLELQPSSSSRCSVEIQTD